MLLWEYATAAGGLLLGINPFDQPDVERAKNAARRPAGATAEPAAARFVDGGVEVARSSRTCSTGSAGTSTPRTPCSALLAALDPDRGYLAVMVYLDRQRPRRPRATCATPSPPAPGAPSPSAGGRGSCTPPGSSTRAAPRSGCSCRSPATAAEDLAVPGREFTFGRLKAAQAAGDADVLAGAGPPGAPAAPDRPRAGRPAAARTARRRGVRLATAAPPAAGR